MVFFTTPELLEIGGLPMTSLNEKPGRTEALKYYRRCAEYYGLNIHQYERVLSIEGGDGDFGVTTSQAEYRAISRAQNRSGYRLLRRSQYAERSRRRTG
jgi:thioredoxin reductase (NADPH)